MTKRIQLAYKSKYWYNLSADIIHYIDDEDRVHYNFPELESYATGFSSNTIDMLEELINEGDEVPLI